MNNLKFFHRSDIINQIIW